MPVIETIKWYKGDDMLLTDVFKLSEASIDEFSSFAYDMFNCNYY